MSTTPNVTVSGVFVSAEQADRAVHELRRAGFRAEDIGVVQGTNKAGQDPGCRSEEGVTVGTGAGVGMLTGASLGGLAGAFPGMIAGAAVGGLLGAFLDMGIPEDAACFYQSEAEAGRPVVLVRAAGRFAEAADSLWLHGAQEVRSSTAGSAADR